MNSIRLTTASLDVDFAIGPGVTAVFGAAGAGKTALLEAIAGFERPTAGRILLDDVLLFDAAAGVHLAPQRRKIGFIPKTESLFPHLSLKQNLTFPAKRWPRLERHRRVAEMTERFSLTDESPRLHWAIARALIAEPELLLIDDPGIDSALLRRIRENCPVPILLASNSFDLCCSADQLLLLGGGRILQRGAPRDVIEHPESMEAARALGIPNFFQATVGALDPGRNRSILEFEHFSLGGPYFPGHFRGDRLWVTVAAEHLRAHPGDLAPQPNCVALPLVRAIPEARSVLLEFAYGVHVRVSTDEYVRQKDNKDWRVEFPPEALRIF